MIVCVAGGVEPQLERPCDIDAFRVVDNDIGGVPGGECAASARGGVGRDAGYERPLLNPDQLHAVVVSRRKDVAARRNDCVEDIVQGEDVDAVRRAHDVKAARVVDGGAGRREGAVVVYADQLRRVAVFRDDKCVHGAAYAEGVDAVRAV